MQAIIAEYMTARAHRWRPITRKDIATVLQRMVDRLPPDYLGKPNVGQFVDAMLRTGAPRSRQLYKSVCGAFFQWAHDHGHMTTGEFLSEYKDIRISDEEREPLRVLTREEWNALTAQARKQGPDYCALLKTMLLTCMRAGEIVAIRPTHLNEHTLTVEIPVGKGGRARKQSQVPELKDYWPGACRAIGSMRSRQCASCGRIYRPQHSIKACLCGKDVFIPVNALPQSISLKINRWAGQAGLRQPLHAHTIRRTGATWLYEAGVDISEIQHLLGHRNLATTFEYLKPTPKNIRTSLNVLVEANQDEKETTD
jgi:integrase